MTLKAEQTLDDGTQKDRSITLKCTPTLFWRTDQSIGATVTFTQTASDPNSMSGRVDANGNIRLTNMPSNANYNDNVDITIELDTSLMVDQNGNAVAGRWAYSTEYSGSGAVTGFCWFCDVDVNGQYNMAVPVTITGMTTSRSSDTVIVIDDDTADNGPSYAFCLGLVLPAYNNYYISIDPTITSKTTKTTSFMLKD